MLEVKWAHFPDDVYQLMTFAEVVHQFQKHAVYLQFVTCWYDHTTRDVRDEMDKSLKRMPAVCTQIYT